MPPTPDSNGIEAEQKKKKQRKKKVQEQKKNVVCIVSSVFRFFGQIYVL